MFALNLDAALIGVTLYFKFTSFNITGGATQSLSSVSPYTFTPTGLVGWTYNAGGGGGTQPPSGNAADAVMYAPGVYAGSQEIWSYQPARQTNFPAGLTNSPAPTCDVPPTGSTVSLTINKVVAGVATAVGTLNYTSGSTTGTVTFASAVALNGTGDILQVVGPSSADPTLAGVRFTFWAVRTN